MTFKKVNGSLSVKFDRKTPVEGVIAIVEVTKTKTIAQVRHEIQNDD